jgi:hypothetical protein
VAGDVAFAGHTLTDPQACDTGTQSGDLTHILMTDGHGGLDVLLGPSIPVVDVHIGAADGSLMHPDQNLTGTGLGHGHTAKFQTYPRLSFYNGVHKFHNCRSFIAKVQNLSSYSILEEAVIVKPFPRYPHGEKWERFLFYIITKTGRRGNPFVLMY